MKINWWWVLGKRNTYLGHFRSRWCTCSCKRQRTGLKSKQHSLKLVSQLLSLQHHNACLETDCLCSLHCWYFVVDAVFLQVKEWFGTSCRTQPKTSPFAPCLTASAISITSCSSTPTDTRMRFSPNITPHHSVSNLMFVQAAVTFKMKSHSLRSFVVSGCIDCSVTSELSCPSLSPCICFKAKAVDGYVKPQIKQVVPE